MIACICGGMLEVGFALTLMALASFGVDVYNKIQCKRHKCKHKCNRR